MPVKESAVYFHMVSGILWASERPGTGGQEQSGEKLQEEAEGFSLTFEDDMTLESSLI